MKSLISFFLLLATFALLAGCASGLSVNVDAIADNKIKPPGTRYVLVNDNPQSEEGDLFFKEFGAYFEHLLNDKGYQRVDSHADADMEILFSYTVSDGRTGIHTFSLPIYRTIGGETITFTETKTDGSGTTTTKGSVYIPPRHQFVGTSVESHTYTEFTSSAILEAHLIATDKNQINPQVLWKTVISSTSDSADLRAVMPVMAAAAAPYITGNSGSQVSIVLKQDDPRVLAIRKATGHSP